MSALRANALRKGDDMRRLMIRLTAVIAVCGLAAWQLSSHKSLPEAALADLVGDADADRKSVV